jgi:hypothetical protein
LPEVVASREWLEQKVTLNELGEGALTDSWSSKEQQVEMVCWVSSSQSLMRKVVDRSPE